MFKVSNKDTTRTTPSSGVFIVNFEHISHFVLVFLLLTLSRKMSAGKKCETCSKLTIKTLKRFLRHTSHLVLMFLMLTFNSLMIVGSKQTPDSYLDFKVSK